MTSWNLKYQNLEGCLRPYMDLIYLFIYLFLRQHILFSYPFDTKPMG